MIDKLGLCTILYTYNINYREDSLFQYIILKPLSANFYLIKYAQGSLYELI